MGTRNELETDLDHVLDHTRDLWDELRGERLFITGGTGFFGCWLLESLLWANERLSLNCQVVVLTRHPRSFHKKTPHLAGDTAVTLFPGDVRTFDFPAGHFSYIIHAATESSSKLTQEDPFLMLDTITEGTLHTLDFAEKCRASKYLLTSSGAVYGKQPPEILRIPEEYPGAPDPLDPRSAYAEGKRLAEHLCGLYAQRSEIETKIARCFSFVGPYMPLDAQFAIGNFIRDGLNGGPIVANGDGTPVRSYLYAADLAIWLWTILFKGQSCRPYNVGGDQCLSIAEIAEIVSRCFAPAVKVEIRQQADITIPSARYVPETLRARTELGLHEAVSTETACCRTINFLRSERRIGFGRA